MLNNKPALSVQEEGDDDEDDDEDNFIDEDALESSWSEDE
jgi:hypothetical protein